MHKLLQDLRLALRQLRKESRVCCDDDSDPCPQYWRHYRSIGATTAIFSLVNTVLLGPRPFSEQDRLMYLQQADYTSGAPMPEPLSYPDLFDWHAQNHLMR